MSRTKKISATIDADVLVEAEAAAKLRGRSLSSYISDALSRQQRSEKLAELIGEFETEHGHITLEELEQAERELWQHDKV